MRHQFAIVASQFLLVVALSATPPQEATVNMNFHESPLMEVLVLYQLLTGQSVLVAEDLSEERLSISTTSPTPRGEAIKLMRSTMLGNGLRVEERDGSTFVSGSKSRADSVFLPVRRGPEKEEKTVPAWLLEGSDGQRLREKLNELNKQLEGTTEQTDAETLKRLKREVGDLMKARIKEVREKAANARATAETTTASDAGHASDPTPVKAGP